MLLLTMKRLSILALVVICGCNGGHNPPTTQHAFVEAYRIAFELGQREDLLRLVKWDGVPNDLRQSQEMAYLWFVGKHKVTRIELVPFKLGPDDTREVDGRPTKLNLEPQFWLVVEHEGNEGYEGSKSTGSVRAPVGVEGGVFFICGVMWADHQK